VAQFSAFVEKLPSGGTAVVGIDNPRSAALARSVDARVTTFATGGSADLQADDIVFAGLRSHFTVVENGVVLGAVDLGAPGIINVQNALGAIGAARAANVPFETIAQALHASTTTRTTQPRSRRRSPPRVRPEAVRSSSRFSRIATRVPRISRLISRARSRVPTGSI
jgi:UDP-N-acetylmuramate-alanine ligase